MEKLRNILNELDEAYIVKNISKKHDEARIKYPLNSNTVPNDSAFDELIGDYYNYHFANCNCTGSRLTRAEAVGRAKEIITKKYHRRGLDKLNAYSDGKNGTNGGMREILDIIMETLKEEEIERHFRDVIDRHISPSNWEEQVDIIKELFQILPESEQIKKETPERYARNYEELIRSISEHFIYQAKIFRRY